MAHKITPCLWFDTQAEEAAQYYCSIFKNSRVVGVDHYGDAGPMPAGTVLTAEFEIDGQPFLALNGGPVDFTYSEALSLQVHCDDQHEVDEYWERLTADGGEEGYCGWLKDRYGVSWQIVPRRLTELLKHPDAATVQRVMKAMMSMRKIDVAALERAAAEG